MRHINRKDCIVEPRIDRDKVKKRLLLHHGASQRDIVGMIQVRATVFVRDLTSISVVYV